MIQAVRNMVTLGFSLSWVVGSVNIVGEVEIVNAHGSENPIKYWSDSTQRYTQARGLLKAAYSVNSSYA